MIYIKPGSMEISDNYSTLLYSVCAYCGKYQGTKDGNGIYGVSHTACKSCFEKEIAKMKVDSCP